MNIVTYRAHAELYRDVQRCIVTYRAIS
jgi:hypothetical protein